MATATLAPSITTKVRSDEDSTSIAVRTEIESDQATLTKTFDVFSSADSDDHKIYLTLREHSYASVGWDNTLTTHNDLFTRHLTREEAEAIVKALVAELARN
jgi:hypothetical protein